MDGNFRIFYRNSIWLLMNSSVMCTATIAWKKNLKWNYCAFFSSTQIVKSNCDRMRRKVQSSPDNFRDLMMLSSSGKHNKAAKIAEPALWTCLLPELFRQLCIQWEKWFKIYIITFKLIAFRGLKVSWNWWVIYPNNFVQWTNDRKFWQFVYFD